MVAENLSEADLMEKLIYNKNTEYAVKDFVSAWKEYTGNDVLGLL